MKKYIIFVLIGAVGVMGAKAPQKAKGGRGGTPVYCWEESGKRVCGNAPPAQVNTQDLSRVNTRTGVVSPVVKPVTPKPLVNAPVLAPAPHPNPSNAPNSASSPSSTSISEQTQNSSILMRSPEMEILLQVYPDRQSLQNHFKEEKVRLKKSQDDNRKQIRVIRKRLVEELIELGNKELMGKTIDLKEQQNVLEIKSQINQLEKSLDDQLLHYEQLEEKEKEALALLPTTAAP